MWHKIYYGLTDEHLVHTNPKWSCLMICFSFIYSQNEFQIEFLLLKLKCLLLRKNIFLHVKKSETFRVSASWFTIGKSLMDHLASHCVKGIPWHIEHIIFLFVHTSTCLEKLFAFFYFSCFWYITTHELLHNVMLNCILLS